MAGYNLKNKEEAAEFFKRLFTEYSFGCLSENNPEVCHLLGDYYEVILKNKEKSGEIYKENCENFDFGRSCYKYARYNVTGEVGCPKDLPKAYQYMRKGCQFNCPEACLYTGMMIASADDIGVVKSDVIEEGLEMMRKACYEMKETKACSMLGKIYVNGVEDLVEKDTKRASKLFEKSCEEGDSSACFTLSQMFNRGVGVTKNHQLALKYRRKASEIEEEKSKNVELQFHTGI